jgi:type IV pilus assembly protein PilV
LLDTNYLSELGMRSRKESGFSLIEVMITSFILAVGLLGIVALQGIAKKSITDTDKQVEATFHARTAMEELRADTRWLDRPANPVNDKMIKRILANTVASATTSQLALCYKIDNFSRVVVITTSWQIRNQPEAEPKNNGLECGIKVPNRRQVKLTSLIMEGL